MQLIEPTIEYVGRRIRELDGDDHFYGAECAVELVFQQWPKNAVYEQVLVKTVVLNRLYSTNIYDVWTVAKHICDLRIDDRLRQGDASLVQDIASVKFNEKARACLSFATKYCSWHQQEQFQIMDSYVKEMLWRYKRQFGFWSFYRQDMRHYPKFVEIVDRFRSHFGRAEIGRKQLDKFLWIEGRQAADQQPSIAANSELGLC